MDIPSRAQVIREHRAAGGRVAAVFPIHDPRALLRVFGTLPVEVWGPPGMSVVAADAHLQSYTCSIVRCGLSFLLDGGLEGRAQMVLVPHACDALQGLGSLLLDLVDPGVPVLPFYLPRRQDTVAADYLAAELRALFQRLVAIHGHTPSQADLLTAIQREERADTLLGRLLDRRRDLPLGDVDFYRLVRAREYLPAERFTALAGQALDLTAVDSAPHVPLLLSGLVPEPLALLDHIAEAGGRVVADDYASSGRRCYPPGQGDEPFARLASSLLAAPPGSTRGHSVQQRVEHLLGLARRSGARAVIFHGIKFCEPEQFYLPQVAQALEAAGLRTLVLEVDLSEPLPQQVRTRVEALLETLAEAP